MTSTATLEVPPMDRLADEAPAACVLCGGVEFRRLHQWPVGDRWNPASVPLTVWQCGCDLVALHPVPTAEQLPDGGDWWTKQRKKHRRHPRFKRWRAAVQQRLFGSPRSRLLKATLRAMPAGRLLDVGCGNGGLLAMAAKHYDVVGLEPSPIAAERVRAMGLRVVESTLEEADLPPGSFDVVLMDSVIEHVLNPIDVLRRTHDLLAPGGVVVLKTPKFDGPAYRRHGSAWNGFRHGYHTFLFSGATLSACLEAANFEALARPKRDRPLDDVLILWGRKAS